MPALLKLRGESWVRRNGLMASAILAAVLHLWSARGSAEPFGPLDEAYLWALHHPQDLLVEPFHIRPFFIPPFRIDSLHCDWCFPSRLHPPDPYRGRLVGAPQVLILAAYPAGVTYATTPPPPTPVAPPPSPESAPPPAPIPLRGTGSVRFDVTPPETEIYLDDRYLGRADEIGVVPRIGAGRHLVELRTPAQRTFIGTQVEPGHTTLIQESVAVPSRPTSPRP